MWKRMLHTEPRTKSDHIPFNSLNIVQSSFLTIIGLMASFSACNPIQRNLTEVLNQPVQWPSTSETYKLKIGTVSKHKFQRCDFVAVSLMMLATWCLINLLKDFARRRPLTMSWKKINSLLLKPRPMKSTELQLVNYVWPQQAWQNIKDIQCLIKEGKKKCLRSLWHNLSLCI